MPSNMQMELIELKADSVLRMWNLMNFPHSQVRPKWLVFGDHYHVNIFQKWETLPRVMPDSSELRTDASSHFLSWK